MWSIEYVLELYDTGDIRFTLNRRTINSMILKLRFQIIKFYVPQCQSDLRQDAIFTSNIMKFKIRFRFLPNFR